MGCKASTPSKDPELDPKLLGEDPAAAAATKTQAEDPAAQAAAATKIQATYRGKAVRKGQGGAEQAAGTEGKTAPEKAAGPQMGQAAWLWKAGGPEVTEFFSHLSVAFQDADPSWGGPELCREEGHEALFKGEAGDDFDSCSDQVCTRIRDVSLQFMRDQVLCTEPYEPKDAAGAPHELAVQLAVWRWPAERVAQWMQEDVGILAEAEPALFARKIDGATLLLEFDKGLFDAVKFDDEEVVAAELVKENLLGQCLSFFDVMAECEAAKETPA